MSNPRLHLVVMAGGSGTRFWPKSTSTRPKQLLSFSFSESEDEGQSLLNQTLARFEGIVPSNQRSIVTTRGLADAVEKQVTAGNQSPVEVLAEPQGRNTAPCVYWAARVIADRDPEAVMIVVPSDHYIAQVDNFQETVMEAASWASKNDDLVTLGIKPSRPETGYGYLELGDAQAGNGHRVARFVEKPDLPKAKEYVESGQYLWNGGMFLWRVDVLIKAFDEHMPEMRLAYEGAGQNVDQAYPKMPATSIDYGIMEKASNVVTFPLDCGWDDLGSWTSLDSLAEALDRFSAGGVVAQGDLLAIDSRRNIVDAPGKLVALLGVDDLIVVQNGDRLMVAKKERAQDIRTVVDEVKKRRPDLA